jgi:hypothetical protein
MKVAVALSPRDHDAVLLDLDGVLKDYTRYVDGQPRVFLLNDDATDCGTHRDVPGDAP